MPKKKSRHSNPKPAGPDDPIYTGRFQVYTPYQVRQRPPEPREEKTEQLELDLERDPEEN